MMQSPTNSVNSTVTNYSSTTTSYKGCIHDGDKVVWTLADFKGNKLEFTCADSTGWKVGIHDATLVLDLSNNISNSKKLITSAPSRYSSLASFLPKAPKAEVIKIDWDYNGIDAPLDFWKELMKLLPRNGRVMITCATGHGKSSACLAALLMASGMKGKDALEYVRQQHCKKTCDTKAQEDYVLVDLATEAGDYVGMNTHCAYCNVRFIEPSAESDICQTCYGKGKGKEKVHKDWGGDLQPFD